MKEFGNRNGRVNKEEIIEGLFSDPVLSNFFIENDLNSEVIEDNLVDLLTYKQGKDICEECKGIDKCKQDTLGLEPMLKYEDGKIKISYRECNFALHKNKQSRKDNLINAMFMPKMIFDATFEDYKTNTEARKDIYKYMMSFLRLYPMGEKMKGLYIWGAYQQGKTYSLASLANELIKKGYSVVIAYYPDLVREFKSSIGNGGLEALISNLN